MKEISEEKIPGHSSQEMPSVQAGEISCLILDMDVTKGLIRQHLQSHLYVHESRRTESPFQMNMPLCLVVIINHSLSRNLKTQRPHVHRFQTNKPRIPDSPSRTNLHRELPTIINRTEKVARGNHPIRLQVNEQNTLH